MVTGWRYHIFSSKRHIRPPRTILFGGLGLWFRVGVLGVVRVWVRVSIMVNVWVSLVRGYGQGQFAVRIRFRVRVTVRVNTTQNPNPQP